MGGLFGNLNTVFCVVKDYPRAEDIKLPPFFFSVPFLIDFIFFLLAVCAGTKECTGRGKKRGLNALFLKTIICPSVIWFNGKSFLHKANKKQKSVFSPDLSASRNASLTWFSMSVVLFLVIATLVLLNCHLRRKPAVAPPTRLDSNSVTWLLPQLSSSSYQ